MLFTQTYICLSAWILDVNFIWLICYGQVNAQSLGLDLQNIFSELILLSTMKLLGSLANAYRFSVIQHIKGKPERVQSKQVKLRGVHIKSTSNDSPTLIFFPEILDQAESWLNFFTNPNNKITHQRNVYILYPRNFGNSDRSDVFGWEDLAHDVSRFMYEHKISMATLGGHGIGAKIALAASCYHFDKVTGYFGLDSSPMDQFYHEPYGQLRKYLNYLSTTNLNRGYNAINSDFKANILDPKWRTILLNNLVKNTQGGYQWNFNFNTVLHNLNKISPSNLTNWHTSIGLYPGRALFAFPEHSRYVHLATNTLPMYKICPRLSGFNEDIYSIPGDDNPQNHWIYEREQATNPFAFRLSKFLKHYDGVHVLLKNRDQVGNTFIPDINNARTPKEDFPSDRTPAHYHHNWRFNNVYHK